MSEELNLNSALLAAFIVIFTIVFLIWKHKSKSRRSVLILGLSGSGKTVLYVNLIRGKACETYTSITANVGECKQDKKMLRLVDIPGNEKVRQKFFDQYKDSAMGCIFMVDSTTVQNDIRDVAEYLYSVLTDAYIKDNCSSLLILCNKQDGTIAKGSAPIKFLLEKELDLLRGLKTKKLDTLDDAEDKPVMLGHKKKPFEFSQVKPVVVEFAESVAFSENPDTVQITSVKEWLESIS